MKLVEWLQEAWKDGQQVSSSGVRQKAKEISVNPNFKASLGWYMKWQKRHNVNLKDKTIDSPALRPIDSVLVTIDIKDGEGFLLVYSITEKSTFLTVKNIYSRIDKIKDAGCQPIPVILVGNKVNGN